MKKLKWKGIAAIALASMLALSGCGGGTQAPAEGGGERADLTSQSVDIVKATDTSRNPQAALDRKDTIVIGTDDFNGVFIPQLGQTVPDRQIYELLFEPLVGVDEEGKPIDDAIATWTVEDDVKYTFTIKDGVVFSDGTPVTAEDVEFSYLVIADPTYDASSDIGKYGILGVDAYKNGQADSIEGIKVIDEKTIEFTLEKPNAEVIYFFTLGIIPKAYYGEGYTFGDLSSIRDLQAKPMGSGPYKFVDYKEGQTVTLVANENYWQGTPGIPNVIFKVTSNATQMQEIISGQIDMQDITVSVENVEQLKAAGFVDLHIFPTNGYGYLGMNHELPKFSDVRVRQALTYAINRKDATEAIYGPYGNVLNIPQSRVSWSFTDEGINSYDYDLEKAASLLDEAGWEMGDDGFRYKDGEKFEIFFTGMSDHPVLDILLPMMIESYKELGIDFKVEYVDFPTLIDKTNNYAAEMWFLAWSLTPDPGSASNVYRTGGPQNKYNYSNPAADQLWIDGVAETDFNKRAEIYGDLYRILNEDIPVIIIYQRSDMWAANSRLENFNVSPYRTFTKDLWKVTIAD
ncbi:peptide/nickel transport system substrate-binding protein [Acetoanaerobium pronyense]|uniref:Peptide/nickel transport system substrate-binding protein n=1 Tax=Acetoanaerobium pronyense TaxID=1482736 RepID=A0ABS4KM27_9FIRM|nr:ABC transporter substrate-binding protein [Acetoanaerobium pronyense]MBP2028826.1 peptide/nickel transport system substrate-binding protein [Acetoanaerobium pronyense]